MIIASHIPVGFVNVWASICKITVLRVSGVREENKKTET
jgi:hypothetical protein